MLAAAGVSAVAALLSWLRRPAAEPNTSEPGFPLVAARAIAATALLWLPEVCGDAVGPEGWKALALNPIEVRLFFVLVGGGMVAILLLGLCSAAASLAVRSRASGRAPAAALEASTAWLISGAALGVAEVVRPSVPNLLAVLTILGLAGIGAQLVVARWAPTWGWWLIAVAGTVLWVCQAAVPYPGSTRLSATLAELGFLAAGVFMVALVSSGTRRRLALALAWTLACVPVVRAVTRAGREYPSLAAPQAAFAAAVAPAKRPNVVMVLVDTLRADHMGPWGYLGPTTPLLDGWLARPEEHFTLFREAWSNAAWTTPAVTALFSSRLSSDFGGPDWTPGKPRHMGPSAATFTLAEAFHASGYATMGVSANPLVTGDGFAQGFDEFVTLRGWDRVQASFLLGQVFTAGPQRELSGSAWAERLDVHKAPGEAAWEVCRRWLGRNPKSPSFAYVHLVDSHWPYRDHGYEPAPWRRNGAKAPSYIEMLGRSRNSLLTATRERIPGLVPLMGAYDQEVRYVDTLLARIRSDLERDGLLDSTLLVILADHGEEFFERGRYGHGHDVFPEQLHVPLLVRWPRQPRFQGMPREVRTPVSLIDVFPTLSDLLELRPPEPPVGGRSLRPLLEGGDTAPVPLLAEAHDEGTVVGAYREGKLAVRLVFSLAVSPKDSTLASVYSADDGTTTPTRLEESSPEIATLVGRARGAWARRWDTWERSVPQSGPDSGAQDEVLEQLRALGYVQ
jgi:arylsulfatase A-like enzyme